MLLRFRRHCVACFALLALETALTSIGPLAQDVSTQNQRNALRLGDTTGTPKPTAQISKNVPPPNSDVKKTIATIEPAPKTNISLIVASKEIPSEIGVEPSPNPSEVDVDSEDANDQNLDLDESELVSPLAMKIATATMSHVSPFFWLLARSTSGIETDSSEWTESDLTEEIADEPTLEGKPIDADRTTRKLVKTEADSTTRKPVKTVVDRLPTEPLPRLTDRKTAVIDTEPPRMAIDEDPVLDLTLGDEMTAEAEEERAEVEPEKVAMETAPRKPTPRPIRIPFNNEEEDEKPSPKNSGGLKQGIQLDKDSQRDQEEPQIDPRNNRSEREHQGIDALKASKPIANHREIRIDDPKNEGIQVAPIVQAKPLDAVLANRLQRTETCLAFYLNNPESTSVRSPWAMMHALLAFGGEYEMVHGQGRVNAIGWMCHNGTCRTQRMFTPTTVGFKPNVGDGVQGHESQFLAILAQSNVPLNYPIQVGASKFTVEDLVRYEMATCKEKTELTFKLIGLSYYLDSNKQWRANDGKLWSISKLIQEELAQPIIGAACGGVHRLMGFSFSIRQRQLQGMQVNGQYARAAKFVKEYIDYTWQLQNPDGSFSTSWYEGRANEPNEERKLQTTGHMLEWLMYTLSDEEIKSPRVGKSIDFLLSKIYDKRENKWPIGPRGHATRALALYNARTKESLSQSNRSLPVNSAVKSQAAPIRK